MAQAQQPKISKDAQDSLMELYNSILAVHDKQTDFVQKLQFIDVAYARYKFLQEMQDGVDTVSRETECGVNLDEITVPVVVSQVDSYVGYLTDIYLSGYPIFPVVSPPDFRVEAEALQAIIDDHAVRSRYVRQFIMNFYDGVKYNLTANEIEWCEYDSYVMPEPLQQAMGTKKGLQSTSFAINKSRRLDPYNFIFDRRVAPVDVPYHGAYAGYVEAITDIELYKRLDYYQRTGFGYNTKTAFSSHPANVGSASTNPYVLGHFAEAPQVSNTMMVQKLQSSSLTDWVQFFTGERSRESGKLALYSDMHEHVTLYVRIIPKYMKIYGEGASTAQVWKICVVNSQYIVYAARVYSMYDMIPIFISQPREDGMQLQTVSVAEGAVDFQQTASKLLGIRLNSARRAIMDRAIYDPLMINKSHLDSAIPAPKIPLRDRSQLAGKKISDAYFQIPFDSRGTETVIADLAAVLRMADTVNGTNQPFQGQFQKGNKTRREWVDTMEGAANRLRIPALSMEYQFFLPIKEQLKLNIFQHGVEGSYQNSQNGKTYKVDAAMLDRIRQNIQMFKLADGFHPADKIASSDVLTGAMTTLNNSPQLQAAFGPNSLPKIFLHLLQLGGVTGVDQYISQLEAQPAQATVPVEPNATPA